LTVDDIIKIKGMAVISAQQFVEHIPEFFQFYEELGIKCKKNTTDISPLSTAIVSHLSIFKYKKIVFTGFRNKDYEQMIEAVGGKIVTSISKSTDYLIVKDKNETSTKVEKATEFGVQIMSKDELERLL
jgi:NAD-dependent DNA ligase